MVINSLEYTGEPLTVMKEIQRVIKPGGYVCFGILGPTAEPRKNSASAGYWDDEVIMNTMQPWEFEKMALETGWKAVADLRRCKERVDYAKLGHFQRNQSKLYRSCGFSSCKRGGAVMGKYQIDQFVEKDEAAG